MYFVIVLLGLPFFLQAHTLFVPVNASSAILINARNGKVLFEKNADQKKFPGSTTKIASCVVALKKKPNFQEPVKCPLECLLKIPQKVKIANQFQDPPYILEPDGVSYGIYPGEILSFRDLLYGMMVYSANDAANVVAHHLAQGSIDAYMEEVNTYLQSIGCSSTRFYNPHGLHHPKHVTTARDLARLAQEAIQMPEFLEIMKTVQYERPKTNKQTERMVWTGNRLLRKGPFYYPKAFGIKTGYHAAAGHCFVGAAKDDSRVLISVVLQCASKAEAFKDTLRMFEAAFGEKRLTRQLMNHKDSLFVKKVKEGKRLLQAGLQEDFNIEYFPSEEEELKPELVWQVIKAPIKKGDKVGEVHIKTLSDTVIKSAPLYAIQDVDIAWSYKGYYYIKEGGKGLVFFLFILGLLAFYEKRQRRRGASIYKRSSFF